MTEMKLGFFTDVHARATSPEGRTDSFRESIFKKMYAIGEIWKQSNVDYVICGGDLFDSPEPPNSVLYEMIDVLKSWNKEIYSAIGSHDYFGYQLKSFDRTALGILHCAGVLRVMGLEGESNEVRLDVKKRDKMYPHVDLVFNNHTYWLEQNPKELELPDRFPELVIQVIHGSVVMKPVPFPHILAPTLNTHANLVLSGHIHQGWGVKKVANGVTFCNPGSVGRLENTGEQRTPQVVIVTIIKDDDSHDLIQKIELIDIPGALGHPFNDKVDKKINPQVQDVARFLQMVQKTNIEAVDLKQQIPLIAEKLGYGSEVIETAFKLIEGAKT
ncbi:MAG: metallophosphoesterase family protein [Candidatus Omnitrophica bacterium]|jgi:DNA repair exonuclease SbcCD nuclease subunit|nr:metallophosphoesterase family protein [Candidatus Omnitrophota bacterium]